MNGKFHLMTKMGQLMLKKIQHKYGIYYLNHIHEITASNFSRL